MIMLILRGKLSFFARVVALPVVVLL